MEFDGFRSLGSLVLALAVCSSGCRGPSSDDVSPYFFEEHIHRAETSFDEIQFRSFRPDMKLADAITLSTHGENPLVETRRALVPPVPSRLTFEVTVPTDPVLHFAMGVLNFGQPTLSASVDFKISVDPGSGEETGFEDTVRRFQPDRWFDREVDLSQWSGRRVRLTFETERNLKIARSTPDEEPLYALWGNPVLVSRKHQPERPNIILISIDCLRADHLGAYGYERNTTPRIDQLAEDGTVFETVVSTAPWTFPSHMSMLTGLPPSIHGATRWSKLHRSVPFLPELLTEMGYRADGTVAVDYISQAFGFERGFHSYRFSFDPGAARIVDDAIELVRRGVGQSQFLFVHTLDVHWPYWPPEEFRTMFGPRPPDVSELLHKVLQEEPPASQQEIDHVINLYDSELAYVDNELGRLFDELKSLGLYDPSLIILTADHGEAFYEHRFWKHTQTLYDEMTHIPLIVKWPGRAHVGRSKLMVSQTDVFPTILETAGMELPNKWSKSVRKNLTLPSQPMGERKVVSEVMWDARPTRPARMKVSFRTDELKYIATLHGPAVEALDVSGVSTEELYHLGRDPEERVNLLSAERQESYSDALQNFREQLASYFTEARGLQSGRRGTRIDLDEEVIERLRRLGYVEQD